MKRVFIISMIFILLFVGFIFVVSSSLRAVEGSNLDVRLQILLNDETLPFFPDDVRQKFLTMGMKKCATMCNQVARIKTWGYVTTGNTEISPFSYTGLSAVLGVEAVKIDDEDFSLLEIRSKDIGRKKIATSEAGRYWYTGNMLGSTRRIKVYPILADSTAYDLYLYGIPGWADTSYLNPGFENEPVLYAFYLCKLRQGEMDVARFIRQIAVNEILDLKAILENMPVDATILKEVVAP